MSPRGHQVRGAGLAVALGLAALLGLAQPGPAGAAPSPLHFSRETPVVLAVRRASPAVVNISCEQVVEASATPFEGLDPFFEGFFRDFFEPRLRRKVTLTSLGSGVIIDGKHGYIVTNEHVVRNATGIKVVLADSRTFDATLVGADPDFDLAVLKVDAKGSLPEIPFGESNGLLIGETVIAIGNPFGFSHSVTTGVVSATHRSIKGSERVYSDFIQTDASINPGNSGGPLLNINGEIVGVNTAIYAKAQGIGFAIPIDRVRRITRALIEHGEVLPAWIGLEVKDAQGPGVQVTYLSPQGPAARAGVQLRDTVLAAGGEPVSSASHFREVVASHTAGEVVSLRLRRSGRDYNVALTATSFPLKEAEGWAWRELGFRVVDLSAGTARALGLERARGAVIKEVRSGSPAARVGLAPGDLIKRVGEGRVGSAAEFCKAVSAAADQDTLSILVQRGQFEGYVDLKL